MKKPTKTPPTTATIIQMPAPAAKKESKRRAEDKWSPQVMRLGYTTLPNLLLKAQARLKITPMQMNVLVHLLEHWWEAGKNPFPAKDTIARRMRKSPRMVQRYITQLESAGYIKRIQRFSGRKAQLNNAYAFDGLIKKLQEFEPEFSKEASQKRLRSKKLETAKAS